MRALIKTVSRTCSGSDGLTSSAQRLPLAGATDPVGRSGAIVERGRHEESIPREGAYHQLYTVQARI